MKLTTKSRCAIAGMIDLAMLEREGTPGERSRCVKLVEISARQDISLSYLEQLFHKLRKAGLVVSSRGRNGGYRLSRSPSLINMAEIIVASGDTLDATTCGGKGDCKSGGTCLVHHMWTRLNRNIYEELKGISIQEVLEMNERSSKKGARGERIQGVSLKDRALDVVGWPEEAPRRAGPKNRAERTDESKIR